MVSTSDVVPGAAEAIAFARAQLGKPYVFGAAGPNVWDCSGLVMKAWQRGGVNFAHSTYTMIHQGVGNVAKADLLPGDLIFPNPGHVQLYSGNGKVIEAPETGIPVREVPMWGFWRARRAATATASLGITGAAPAGSTFTSSSSTSDNGESGLIDWITNGHNWFRIGECLAGGAIMYVALSTIGVI